MKKVVLVLAMVALTFGMNAQEIYLDWSQGSSSVVVEPGKHQGKMYLDMNKKGDYGLVISKGQGESLVNFIQQGFDKFEEWKATAEEKNVTELNKVISSKSYSGFFKYGSWKFGSSKLSMNINIKEGDAVCYLYASKMTASDNRYMKSDSVLFFVDDVLIGELKGLLSAESIDSFIKGKNSVDDIFNQNTNNKHTLRDWGVLTKVLTIKIKKERWKNKI